MSFEEQGALTEPVFYILLSLHQPMHGYAIMQEVQELTQGRVNLGAGTLYGALGSLVEKGWIEALGEDANSRRKEYTITTLGKRIFLGELQRLAELLAHGRSRIGGGE